MPRPSVILIVFLVGFRFVTPSSTDDTLEALPTTAETVKRKYNNYKKPESKRNKYTYKLKGSINLRESRNIKKWMYGRRDM
jgi:hypothetical protein